MIEYTMHLKPRIKTIKSKNYRIELHYHVKEVRLYISKTIKNRITKTYIIHPQKNYRIFCSLDDKTKA